MPFRAPPPSQLPSALSTSSSPSSPLKPSRSSSVHGPSPPSVAPSATGTLRLPAPPPPPKPLHLTMRMSVRGRAKAFENGTVSGTWRGGGAEGGGEGESAGKKKKGRPGMPLWADEDGEEENDAGGTVKAERADVEHREEGDDDVREANEARAALEKLFAPVDADDFSSFASPTQPSPSAHHRDATSSSTSTSLFRTPVDTLRVPPGSFRLNTGGSGSGSSSRRASTIKVRDKDGRVSIFFDATRENPFLPAEVEEGGGGAELDEAVGAAEEAEEADEQTAPSPSDAHPASPDSSALSTPSPAPRDLPAPCPDAEAHPSLSLPDDLLLPLPGTAFPAVALHGFAGEPSFGELSFEQSAALRIEIEDLGGGWSLGFVESEGEEGRGLVPRGWYAYVDLLPPASPAPPSNVEPAPSSLPLVTPPSLAHDEPVKVVTPEEEPLVASPEAQSPAQLRPLSLPPPPKFCIPALPATVHGSPVLADSFDMPTTPPSPAPEAACTPPPLAPPSPSLVGSDPDAELAAYATRSIGRHVVVSGIEFEPIPGTPTEEIEEGGEGGELSVEELLRLEEAAVGRERGLETVKEEQSPREEQGEPVNLQDGGDDGLLNRRPSSPAPRSAPPAVSIAPAPAGVSASFLFRLGLASTPSASGFSLSLPLPLPGRPTLPGGSVLAATSAPSSPPRKKRLPRLDERRPGGVVGGDGREAVLRWVEEGDEMDEKVEEEQREREDGREGKWQVWDIETGPAWRPALEPFVVHVLDPTKHSPLNEAAYTCYTLTTVFSPSTPPSPSLLGAPTESPSLTVTRRFSHFTALHALLSARFLAPLITLPPLPPKAFGAARFADAFVEQRRGDLERWIERVARHSVVGQSEELRGFLAIEGEKELLIHLHLLPSLPSSPTQLPLFPARVFHPEFNVDPAEAEELVDRFERHCRALELGAGWARVEQAVGRAREGERGAAHDLQQLSHALVHLVAAHALPPSSHDPPSATDISNANETGVQRQQRRAKEWNVQNSEGGMSWTDEDDGALCLAKAVQATAEALAQVADLKDETARTSLLGVQEILHETAHPLAEYSGLIDLHRALLARYRQLARLSSSGEPTADVLARCETVLNITCAEIERVRVERTDDLRVAVEGWLDAAIEVQEQSLSHLRAARAHFDPPTYSSLGQTGPRLRSVLEVHATSPVYPPLPLPSSASAGAAAGGKAALGWAGAAVGSVFAPAPASTAAGGLGGLRRAQTVTGATGRAGLYGEQEEGDEPRRGTWRESIWGGTMRLWQ
ncbi:hypothetical protein JCM10207_008383 [Rhodosporidiobolus poonsookiae]